MATLNIALLVVPAALVVPAHVDPVDAWRAEISAASFRFGVPERWIRVVMRLESGGRTLLDGRPIRSPKGAIGLMQLMPGTWDDMRARHGLGLDPDLPADNILAGTAYLRFLYDRFGYPGLFAAYHAGPARYAAWRDGRASLPSETRVYLRDALALLGAPPVRSERAEPTEDRSTWRTLFVSLAAPARDEGAPQ